MSTCTEGLQGARGESAVGLGQGGSVRGERGAVEERRDRSSRCRLGLGVHRRAKPSES